MSYQTINLQALRNATPSNIAKIPFPHQQEAFQKLNERFDFAGQFGKSGMLVLPTGAGKTFTAVRWLCQHALAKNWKVLWLAHSFFLLDQAQEAFCQEAPNLPLSRESLNIRVISSNPAHDQPHSIALTDDVVVITTPSAIKNLHLKAVDNFNRPVKSSLMKFVEASQKTGLFVVLDEAHHAPAYGCRTLLVGDKDITGLKQLVPYHYLLGLTATPTYTDQTRRGWLDKIFEPGIIYQATRPELITQGILARPNYIQKPTGREFEIDDALYNRLARAHKDLPEDLIQTLADDHLRNDYIVDEYLKNRKEYGKTIIFADRWYQCVYLKTKLQAKGVKADAIYSHIDADPGSSEIRNQRDASENGRVMDQFRKASGPQALEVLINIRMLTEGVDVPDARTVFITRQTTSTILMTQMVGRALRGPKAGGEAEANIVLFVDDWKRLLPEVWADPAQIGGTEAGRSREAEYSPLEFISIRLVEILAEQIEMGKIPLMPFLHYVPTGWYLTEIAISSEAASDEIQVLQGHSMVYEHNQARFEKFLEKLPELATSEWGQEHLDPAWMQAQAQNWIDQYFDRTQDDFGNMLEQDLITLARHYSQQRLVPKFYSFEERSYYDLDKFAGSLINATMDEIAEKSSFEFAKPGSLWKPFYKTYDRFFLAVLTSIARQIKGHKPEDAIPLVKGSRIRRTEKEPSSELALQVKRRDNNTCLACEAKGKGIKLQIDHIVPWTLGGETELENLQTLCSVCNRAKDINEINFRSNVTQLNAPKLWASLPIDCLIPRNFREEPSRSLTRIVNFYYHCKAVDQLLLHKTKGGSHYSNWQLQLYQGNDSGWLNANKAALLGVIQQELGCKHVKNMEIV